MVSHHWWQILERIYVGDKFEMLVTDRIIRVTLKNRDFLVQHHQIVILSPTSSIGHRHKCINITVTMVTITVKLRAAHAKHFWIFVSLIPAPALWAVWAGHTVWTIPVRTGPYNTEFPVRFPCPKSALTALY